VLQPVPVPVEVKVEVNALFSHALTSLLPFSLLSLTLPSVVSPPPSIHQVRVPQPLPVAVEVRVPYAVPGPERPVAVEVPFPVEVIVNKVCSYKLSLKFEPLFLIY
jgi:hypothetical protein